MGTTDFIRRVILGVGACVVLSTTITARANAVPPDPTREVPLPPSLMRCDTLWVSGQTRPALAALDSIVAAARARGDSLLERRALYVRGRHRFSAGLLPAAEADLKEALRRSDRVADSLESAWCVRWLGTTLESEGKVGEGAAAYEDLHRRAEAINHPLLLAIAEWGLAWQAESRGEFTEARRRYESALGSFRALNSRQNVTWVLLALERLTYRMGDYSGARQLCFQLIKDSRAIGNARVEAGAFNNLAALELEVGDPGRAVAYLRQAIQISDRVNDPKTATHSAANLGLALHALGREREAAALLDSTIAIARANQFMTSRIAALGTLADVREAQGRISEATRVRREVLDYVDVEDSESWTKALLSVAATEPGPIQSIAYLHRMEARLGRRMRPADIESCRIREADWLLQAGLPEKALALLGGEMEDTRVDRCVTRARCFRALSRSNDALLDLRRAEQLCRLHRERARDPEWREANGAQGRAYIGDLVELLLETGDVRSAFEAANRYKAQTFLERMSGPDTWGRDSATVVPGGPVRLELIQSDVLLPGELFLDAVVGERASFLFAVTRDSCRVVKVPGFASLTDRLALYSDLVSRPPAAGGESEVDLRAREQVAASISQTLLGPAAHLVAYADRIIFSPDGPLNFLPLGELPIPPRGPDGAGRLLLEGREISRVPSAAVLELLRKARSRPDSAIRVLAFGAIDSAAGALPGVERETRDLERDYSGVTRVLLNSATAESTIALSILQGFGVLHLSAHTRIDDERPWNSALLIRSSPDPERVIEWRASDILARRLPARLCVLPDCRSAMGKIVSGEGVQGLSGAFLAAGASSVVASLWLVDDATTSGLMRELYRGLADGLSVSASLARAQELIRSRPATRSPFYWAGFVVVGSGEIHVPLLRRTPVGPLPWAIAALLLGIAVVSWFSRRTFRRRTKGLGAPQA